MAIPARKPLIRRRLREQPTEEVGARHNHSTIKPTQKQKKLQSEALASLDCTCVNQSFATGSENNNDDYHYMISYTRFSNTH